MEAEKNVGKASTKRPRRQSFYRLIKALSPFPYLIKARDYYIRSVTECAGKANSGMVSGAPGPGPSMSLPKSFSTASSRNEEDFRELVRAASQRSAVSRSSSTSGGGIVMCKPQPFPRSFSTSTGPMVGRIE